jgi:death on curing protein
LIAWSKTTARRLRSSQTSSASSFTYLTAADVRDVVHRLVQRRLAHNEPIPPPETVDLGRLESALWAPQQAFDGEDVYPSIAAKAAILVYSLVKNHPWSNGNKRMAMMSVFLFLGMNRRWWYASDEEIRAHLAWVAASDSGCFESVKEYLRCYFERKLDALPADLVAP